MTMTLDIGTDVEGAIREAARKQGQTPEEVVAEALRTIFARGSALSEADQQALTEARFYAAAEATRSVWDTPEEDKAWAHLQEVGETSRS